MQWLFWVIYPFKKGSKTSLWCIFSAWFSNKNVPYWILYQWTQFQCHKFFPSQDTKQNVIKFLFRQLMTSQALRFIFDQPLKQWLTGKKRGADGNTKNWISWERKAFFIVFEGLSLGEKNENLMKIADKSLTRQYFGRMEKTYPIGMYNWILLTFHSWS